eukprot:TRINITY_DN8039_c0_g1_i1.p1 TRINITY_DN8039_c0_g1~~TRINITY_DN8039_c0_g1_i1.p1  ORF type:complete len:257 (+),score=40.54 TRINITY_DN8039_c0_g1_i1:25-771(+)
MKSFFEMKVSFGKLDIECDTNETAFFNEQFSDYTQMLMKRYNDQLYRSCCEKMGSDVKGMALMGSLMCLCAPDDVHLIHGQVDMGDKVVFMSNLIDMVQVQDSIGKQLKEQYHKDVQFIEDAGKQLDGLLRFDPAAFIPKHIEYVQSDILTLVEVKERTSQIRSDIKTAKETLLSIESDISELGNEHEEVYSMKKLRERMTTAIEQYKTLCESMETIYQSQSWETEQGIIEESHLNNGFIHPSTHTQK